MNARVVDAVAHKTPDALAAGRSCPLHYRYSPASLASLPTASVDTLYCVGGMYGNLFALDVLEALLDREHADTQVVFNGDFHWFDATPDAFADVEARTLRDPRYTRLRGNVETEIANDSDVGCGCAYPDSVDDGVVERSNDILRALRRASLAHPALRTSLAALPMTAAFRIGAQRVVAVHGDLESLAGWRLDPNSLDNPNEVKWALQAMRSANADIVASSHTCLPALRQLGSQSEKTVVNNGAAGMPCFAGQRSGVVTRIAREPAAAIGVDALYGVPQGDVFVEAIALNFDFTAWRTHFLQMWPESSAAHRSYLSRIEHGVNFSINRALGRVASLHSV